MLPLCVDEGVQTIVYGPLARGRLARPWGASTPRSENEAAYAPAHHATAESDQKIAEAVSAIAAERVVSRAQVAFAWLRRHPAVGAPIVGALKTLHIEDAVSSLSMTLTNDEAARL